MDLKVGDVVRWARKDAGEAYEPGVYVVIHLYGENWHNHVKVQHLDGRPLHLRYKEDPPGEFPQEHHDINGDRLTVDEFLTAARKANLPDAKTTS